MSYSLRDYQLKGKELIQERFRDGQKKVMLWAMTGSGKGLWMSDFNNDAILRGQKTINVMKRREIVFQTVRNYKKYHGIEASPIMGQMKGIDLNKLCQVASIDTLNARIKDTKYDCLKQASFIQIDECHDLTAANYKKVLWWLEGYNPAEYNCKDFEEAKNYFSKYYIGLTATPFRVGKRCHTFWQSVVKPIEAHELRDRGFLTDAIVYAPNKIDTTGLRIDYKTGDFNQKDLFERVSKLQIVGDVVETYKQYGKNLPAVCFTVNQAHSKIMTEAFNMAGIPAVHCDANHSQKERDLATAGLRSGKYKILSNCNIFSVGFDAPFVEVLISARPSESENLVLQQWGRVLRPYKICANCKTGYGGDNNCYVCGSSIISYEKGKAIILDHANNTTRWGLPYDIRYPELEPIDTARKRSSNGLGVKTCPKCFAVLHSNERFCICGHDFVESSQQNALDQIINVKGELAEVNTKFLRERKYQKIKEKYNQYKRIEMLRDWDSYSKYYKLYDDFGDDLFEYTSEFGIPQALKKKIQKNEIARGIKGLMDNYIPENKKVFS